LAAKALEAVCPPPVVVADAAVVDGADAVAGDAEVEAEAGDAEAPAAASASAPPPPWWW
jgi:hypothetical protein